MYNCIAPQNSAINTRIHNKTVPYLVKDFVSHQRRISKSRHYL